MRQRRHRAAHLAWRGVIAALGNTMMFTGMYPLVPHVLRRSPMRVAIGEWALAIGASAVRPCGFLPLPGAEVEGPRPVIVVHGYAMNRANFVVLARRLARAGLGPVLGFEYWTLGKTASAAKKLAAYVEEVRAATGAREVDIVGHSMGGVVGRYFVQLGGGDGVVRNLVTLGTPHAGTDVSAIGIGRAQKELFFGSNLLERLRAAPPPSRTKMTVIWSRNDALVPGERQAHVLGAEEMFFDHLGHLGLLVSRPVADAIIERLKA